MVMSKYSRDLLTMMVWLTVGAIVVMLARRDGGRLAGVWVLLIGVTLFYFAAWLQADPKSNERMVSAPWWLRVVLLRKSATVGFQLGLMQLAALGFAVGVLVGAAVGRGDLRSLLPWGLGLAVITTTIGALLWWSWLMTQRLE
jgi:hypothetical protein